MAVALECPKCHAPMTSELDADADGVRHTLHAKCDGCGLELDLADRSPSRFSWLDRLALALSAVALFVLVAVAASLEQFERMVADLGAGLPKVTELTLRYQLPLPFLFVSGLLTGLGGWRQAKGLSAGRKILWIGCALGIVGALVCLLGLYGPVFEMAGQVKEE